MTTTKDNAMAFQAPDLDYTTYLNVINGKLSPSVKTRHSLNPASGQPNWEAPVSTPDDVDKAVECAQVAFKKWAKVPYEERQKAVLAFADGLEAEKENLAKLLVQEQGKPTSFAHVEIDFAIQCVREMAVLKLPVEEIAEGNRKIVVRYTPMGLAVGIIPWNYPILLSCAKIAPCVVTGNPMIVKPSPFTPYSGLKIAELAQRYFPPGVVQALSGDDNLGPWLTEHPGPAKITFTGSTVTGKKVMASASKTLKRVTLELGGNDAAIVCEDVDIERVAQRIAELSFLNAGQLCLAVKRIFVHESIFDKFREAVVKSTMSLKYGPGTAEGVYLGPIQNQMQYERVKTFFEDIRAREMKVAVGGEIPSGPGYLVPPTIIDRPALDSRIVVEEPFGPIVPLLSFKTYEEAIEESNNTKYGLGASVWSKDLERADQIAEQLDAGSVWVNMHYSLDPRVSNGGHKESGMGLEWGVGGLKSFCNSQTMYLQVSE